MTTRNRGGAETRSIVYLVPDSLFKEGLSVNPAQLPCRHGVGIGLGIPSLKANDVAQLSRNAALNFVRMVPMTGPDQVTCR